MLSFKAAVKKADEMNANNGEVTERTDCFIFNSTEEDFNTTPLVLLKSTGKDLNYMAWLSSKGRETSKYVINHRLVDGKWEKYTNEIMLDEED